MITLELKDYNIDDAITALIYKVAEDKPLLTIRQYAELLSMSERTLFRYFQKHNINITHCGSGRTSLAKAMRVLEKNGYTVLKQKENA